MQAPSGLNNQPWRFVIVHDAAVKRELAKLTRCHTVIENAFACIAVFIDRVSMYNEVKDHQSMGACLQNMLLAAHALGLGAVWLGEILKNAEAVQTLLELADEMELMAVVAVGHSAKQKRSASRKKLSGVVPREV